MQNKQCSVTVAVAASAGNLLNPPTVTGGVNAGSSPCYILIRHIRVVNKDTAAAVPVSLFIGATGGSAAGTEFAWSAQDVGAKNFLDWYGQVRLDSTQYLTGLAGTVSKLVATIDYEIGVA